MKNKNKTKLKRNISILLLIQLIFTQTLPILIHAREFNYPSQGNTNQVFSSLDLIDNMYTHIKETVETDEDSKTKPNNIIGNMYDYLIEGTYLEEEGESGQVTKNDQDEALRALEKMYEELLESGRNLEEEESTRELLNEMYEMLKEGSISSSNSEENYFDFSDTEQSGEPDTLEPTKYPDDYEYSSAIEDSFIASQFIRPFESSMSWVLQDKELKDSLPSLYTEETNLAVNLNYRDIYYRNPSNEKVAATVSDLFSIGADGEGREYYIEYWEELLDENDEPYIVYHDLRVYYTNPYSYFYLTMALSDSSERVTKFKQSKADKVQLDQYGNIVLNKPGAMNHAIVIPNYSNPDLTNKKEFYLPSRLFLVKYDTGNMGKVVGWSEEANWPDEVKASTFKNNAGDVLHPNAISMYDNAKSTRVLLNEGLNMATLTGKIKALVSDKLVEVSSVVNTVPDNSAEYRKYLGAHDGKYEEIEPGEEIGFVFGNAHINYMMNRYQSDSIQYSSLGEIGTNGIWGVVNSSFVYLPKEHIHFGPSDIGFTNYKINIKTTTFDNGGVWSPYMHGAANKGVPIFNQEGKWGTGATLDEVFLIKSMLANYVSDIDFEKMDLIANYSTGLDTKTDNAIPTNPEGEEISSAEQKSNSIIDIMHFMLNNIGSAMVAMQTSKMSITYKNIMSNLEENYLFHVSNILESETMSNLIKIYMRIVIWLNLIWFLYWTFRLYSGLDGGIIEVLTKFAFVVVLSTLPLVVLIYYCMGAEMYTGAVFKDTFVYWSLVDMDIVNRQSDVDRQYVIDEMEFFRESGRVSYKNHGMVEVYGLTSDSEDKSTEIEFIKSILTAKEANVDNVPDTNKTTIITLSDIVSKGVPNGGNKEGIMANKANYDSSIFYYFYDNFRYHYYSYYEDDIEADSNSPFYDNRGMISSINTYRDMITNPYFLYGPDYNIEDRTTYEPQDILGLSNLFSRNEFGGRPGYYEDIYQSPWFQVMRSNSNRTHTIKAQDGLRDSTDPYNYTGGLIVGILNRSEPDRQYTDFEMALREVNKRTALELQKMNDYSMYTDESLIFMSAIISTMEFNKVMNSRLKPTTNLVPTSFNSQSYSLDTIFRSMFLANSDQEKTYRGDLMWAVESQGGILIQALLIVTAFVGQISGLLNLVAVLMLFITACLVFLVAYNVSRDFFNEAWVGLLGLFGTLMVIHMLFILLVYWICVPVTSVIQTSIFKGYSNGIRTLLLLFALTLRSVAVGVLLFFLAKNYKDLGGSIIAENLRGFVNNMMGDSSNIGPLNSVSDTANISGEAVSADTQINTGDVEDGLGGVNNDNSPEIAREEAESLMDSETLSEEKEVSEKVIGKEETTNNNETEKDSESKSSEKQSSDSKDSDSQSSNTQESDSKSSKDSSKDSSKEETTKETSRDNESSDKEEINNTDSKESEINNEVNDDTKTNNSNNVRDTTSNNTNTINGGSTSNTNTSTKDSIKKGKDNSDKEGSQDSDAEMSDTNKILQELAGIMGDPDNEGGKEEGGIFSKEKKSDEE